MTGRFGTFTTYATGYSDANGVYFFNAPADNPDTSTVEGFGNGQTILVYAWEDLKGSVTMQSTGIAERDILVDACVVATPTPVSAGMGGFIPGGGGGGFIPGGGGGGGAGGGNDPGSAPRGGGLGGGGGTGAASNSPCSCRAGVAGTANTGGGGGGPNNGSGVAGGAGGSGIVILRFPSGASVSVSPGTNTVSCAPDGAKLATFTVSGTNTVTF